MSIQNLSEDDRISETPYLFKRKTMKEPSAIGQTSLKAPVLDAV